MNRGRLIVWLLGWCVLLLPAAAPSRFTDSRAQSRAGAPVSDYPISSVPFTAVRLSAGFWQQRLDTNRTATIPHDFLMCEKTGRIDNFLKAAGQQPGRFEGWWFNDSDVYKVIEAAAYSLATHPDARLDQYLDGLIAKIAAAQEPDGYLYTPRKTTGPEYKYAWAVGTERWKTLKDSHELYDLGHLYEAAVAHYQATGKKSLLNIATKSADLICTVFGPDRLRLVPGHQEIEIGLIKLWRTTGQEKYLKLARFFLDERGRADGHKLYGEYSQDHLPVREQREAVGHAVRAGYMYSGMTDLVALYQDPALATALDHLWTDVHHRKIYLTGGIGAAGGHEGFDKAYDLPNLTAYCETCAAIADALWNQRMFQLSGDGRYIDVLERIIYNGLLSGVALDGKTFFYPNPLESDGRYERKEWYAVACCPPNIARFLPQLPGFAYAQRDDQLYVNLFMAGTVSLNLAGQRVRIRQVTNYPWQGDIRLKIEPEKPGRTFTLLMRLPGWARNEAMPGDLYRFADASIERPTLSINGRPRQYEVSKGYVAINRRWRKGDTITLSLPLPVRRVVSDEQVADNVNKVALQRGPLVYCVEWPDVAGGHVVSLVLPDKAAVTAQSRPELLGGVTVLNGTAFSLRRLSRDRIAQEQVRFTAIPYYAWAHRGKGEMAVWLARTESAARPQPASNLQRE